MSLHIKNNINMLFDRLCTLHSNHFLSSFFTAVIKFLIDIQYQMISSENIHREVTLHGLNRLYLYIEVCIHIHKIYVTIIREKEAVNLKERKVHRSVWRGEGKIEMKHLCYNLLN